MPPPPPPSAAGGDTTTGGFDPNDPRYRDFPPYAPAPVPTPAPSSTSATTPPASSSPASSAILSAISNLLGPSPSRPALPPGYSPPGDPLSEGLNQVGQDPLSQILNSGIAGVIQEGGTPYGQSVASTIAQLINQGGLTQPTQARLTAARDAEAKAFQGQLSDARDALAAQGTLSEPGMPQGPLEEAISRITYNLGPAYAREVSGIESGAMDTANKNVMDALTMATGLSHDQAQNVLQAIGTGTNRQTALGQIALQTLNTNVQWQEFLAQYGLDTDKVMEELQQGRIAQIAPLLSAFLQAAQVSAGGFI